MLVYSRRNTAKPESVPACSPTMSSDPCSILQPWVQTTIFNENENFEAWNRNTVSRKVSLKIFSCHNLIFFFLYSKSNLLLFTRTKVWGRTEKSIPKWDACTRVCHALRWNKANLSLPNGYWVGWEMTKRWDQLTTPFCSATTENWTQKNSANTSLFLPVR